MEPSPSLLQNRYRIVGPLGRGGMGAVYKAVDERFGRTVALKQAFVTTEWMSRAFEREARLLNSLRHPALPVVIDYFQEDECWYLVMDYVPGDDLSTSLARRRQPFAVDDVLRWGDQLLVVLDYLHSHSPPVLHRDIKPGNIKLNAGGEIVLLDFGLAKGAVASRSSESHASSVNAFTPHYAPFEQIRGVGADERSDLYAVAATLYHLVTGTVPVDALERAAAAFTGQADPLRPASGVNPQVPEAVSDVLTRAMSMKAADRPATASGMRHMLASTAGMVAGGLPATADAVASVAPTLTFGDRETLHSDRTLPLGDSADPALGLILDGRYRIDRRIAYDWFTSIYVATQLRFDRSVIIQTLRGDFLTNPVAVDRFREVGLLVARLDHPNVVSILDVGVAPAVGFYHVIEYLKGRDLLSEIAVTGRLSSPQAVAVLRQAVSGVEAVHKAGVIHRDINSTSLCVETVSTGVRVKLMGFGLAKRLGSPDIWFHPNATSGSPVGEPRYMSPEQCRALPTDERTDIYALGCVLYEMLTGRPPFVALTDVELLEMHVSREPTPPSRFAADVAPAVESIALRALAKRPEDRYQSASELAEALDAAVATLAVDTSPPRDADGDARASTVLEAARDTMAIGNLPRHVTNFVGRGGEVADLRRTLASNWLVTLTGVGGMGKTRLALEAASAASEDFPEGAWLVELGKVRNPDFVPQAIAAVLDVREDVDGELLPKIVKALRPRRLLLVLDNCEHVVESCAEAVEAILRACPDVRVLATSREALGLGGEIVRCVPPLTTPNLDELPADALCERVLRFEAVRLFVDRARLGRPGFSVTERNAKAVAAICRRLDGVPLAIELAASRVKMLPVDQILARLNDRFGFLVRGARASLPHQQTLRATIDWSYNLLVDEEKILLRRLGVFGGGFTLEAAEGVCADEAVDATTVAHSLERLVDKSLVVAEEIEEVPRFRMLETVHQYAVERLAESGEEPRLRAAHLAWFVGFAELASAQFDGDDMRGWGATFRAEDYNLDAAMLWARAEGDDETLFRLVDAQHWYWYSSENWEKIRRWLLTPMPSLPAKAQARVAFLRGSFEYLRGDYETSEAKLEACLEPSGGLEPKTRLNALMRLGNVKALLGNGEHAEELYGEALAIGREVGDDAGVAFATLSLAAAARDRGAYDRAATLAEEALESLQALGGQRAILSGGRTVLADIARLRGDYDRAIELAERQLRDIRAMDFKPGLADAISCRADIARTMRDVAAAEAGYRSVLVMSHESGDRAHVAWALEGLAMTAGARGAADRALRLAGAGGGLRDEIKAIQTPAERSELEATVEAARAALGAEAEAAIAEGRAMTLDRAVEYALEA